MRHSELEAKDLENYLGTSEGSLPGTRTGVIAMSNVFGSSKGEKDKPALQDVDLNGQGFETSSVKGHLV
jgi:hypothetical protein